MGELLWEVQEKCDESGLSSFEQALGSSGKEKVQTLQDQSSPGLAMV